MDNRKATPLHAACAWGQKAVADLLISYGADINTIDNEGKSPLFFAVINEYYDLIQLLLEKSAAITIKDQEGETVLDIARKKRKKVLLKLLNS